MNHPSPRDQLAQEAAAYESRLGPDSTAGDDFETQHAGLAKTVRMLNEVFGCGGGANSKTNTEAPPLLTRIGRFRMDRLLGSGSFGSVWLAHDPVLKRDVAIKVAHVGAHASGDLQERFQREAHLAARLRHPNIVPVYETDVDQGRLFIVSEYCNGVTLAAWLTERESSGTHAASVAPDVAAILVRQLADAAEHAHHQGLIHRDIKPSNVLLRLEVDANAVAHRNRLRRGEIPVPQLTDFGLARDLTGGPSSTRQGVLVGTTEYMSPEQATGDISAQAPTSDIFSLGVVLYRLLTGSVPFTGDTDFEVIQKIVLAEPAAPWRVNDKIPRDLSSICLKCLEKKPDRRYDTAAALRDDLDRFLRGEPTTAREVGIVERSMRWAKRAPATAALIIALLLSLTATIVGLTFHLRQTAQHAAQLSIAVHEAQHERTLADNASEASEVSRQAARQTSYRSDMRLAFDLWKRGESQQARKIVQRQLPGNDIDLRDVEWSVLAADIRAKVREIGRHQGAVTECVLRDEEQIVYSAGADGVVRAWDLVAGVMLRELQPHIGEIHALAMSPDGSSVAVGGAPWLNFARVVILDPRTGELQRALQVHTRTIESIEFSPNGQWLAAGSRYDAVQLTRLSDEKTYNIKATRRNRAVSFSPDSQLLVVSTPEGHETWQLSGEEPVRSGQITSKGSRPYLARFAKTSSHVAVTYSNEGHVGIFEPIGRKLLAVASSGKSLNHAPVFKCVAFNSKDDWLVAGNDAGELRIWRPNLPTMVREIETHTPARLEPSYKWATHIGEVTSIAIAADNALISSGEDGRIVLTQPDATGATLVDWDDLHFKTFALADDVVWLGCTDGTVRRLKLHGSQQPVTDIVLRTNSAVEHLVASPDGQRIATATANGAVQIFRSDGRLLRTFVASSSGDEAAPYLAISPDANWLATGDEYGNVKVFDIATGDTKLSASTADDVWSLSFLPDSRRLACGGKFKRLTIFDLADGAVTNITTNDHVNAVAASPDGKWLATAHVNGTVQVTSTDVEEHGAVEEALSGHRFFGQSIDFSPSSRTAISLDKGGWLQFTDVTSRTVLGQLHLPLANPRDYRMISQHVQCNDRFLVVCASTSAASRLFFWRHNPEGTDR